MTAATAPLASVFILVIILTQLIIDTQTRLDCNRLYLGKDGLNPSAFLYLDASACQQERHW